MQLNTRDHQKTKKVTPRAGQLFETTNPEWPNLIGWIARDDLVVGPVRNAFLIYIFKPEIKELNFSTRQDFVKALLLPPLITDITPWKKKSFRTTTETEITQEAFGLTPTFRHPLNGKFYSENGEPMLTPCDPIGNWAVNSESGATKEIAIAYGALIGRH